MIRFSVLLSLVLWLWPGVLQSQDLIDQVHESFTGIESVTVKGIFCNVEVAPGSNGTVSLEGEIRATRRYEDLRIKYTQNGSLLEVWVEQPRNIVGQVKGYLNLTVPVSTLLKVQNVSGSVQVQGVGRELLNLESVSGSIAAADIPCGANLKTVSGSIKATVVDGDLIAKTVSGSLNVNDVKGSAELSSVSGGVTGRGILKSVNASSVSGSVNLSEVFSDVKGKSVSGGIFLTDIKGNISVNSTSGSVSLTNVVGELHATSISGAIRGSGIMLTGACSFKNTSGSINLDLDNDVETLSFDLSTGSGSLEAAGSRGTKHLVVGSGPVKVNGNTASGSQKYY